MTAQLRQTWADLGIVIPAGAAGSIRVECPKCDGKQRKTLSVDLDRDLYHCHRCEWGGRLGGGDTAPRYRPPPRDIQSDSQRKRRAIERALQESVTIDHPDAAPVRRYLRRRLGEVPGPLPQLRFHPACRYYHDRRRYTTWPAMLGLIHDAQDRLVSIHRTYLTDGGEKAPVESPKKIMGTPYPLTCTGAAIRLYPAGGELAVAEGIETALALHLALKVRVWACISAHGLESVVLPPKVTSVLIGSDNDKNGRGQLAAARLRRRLETEGRKVRVITPQKIGDDWADVLMET